MYIFIHIPFCNSLCNYCDFPKMFYDKKFISKYLDSLEKEINQRYKNEPVKTIYIGGGTPTSLNIVELERLLKITNIFNKDNLVEYTIESNIESLSEEKIKLLKKYNINRISLGVESLNNDNLKELNRHHTKEQTLKLIKTLKQNKINNISIDYIYGINNNINIIKEDINLFLTLDIPHISCYSLIIEKNTIFGIQKREYINEDIEYQMYKYINKTLTQNNYSQYEISNYAKENYESLHNLNYWNNGEYYGFGLGAVSYLNKRRITNTKNLTKYLNKDYHKEITYESLKIRISHELILGLRKIKGIDIKEFQIKYKKDILTLYNIKDLLQENKLLLENNYLKINPKYLYLSNEILINLI